MTGGFPVTRSAGIRIGAAIALALALAACGPKGDGKSKDAKGPVTAQSIVEAAADPCGSVSGAYGQALCGDPDLQPLVGQVKSTLVEAANAISTEGAQQLAQGQTAWMESTRVSCGIADTKVPLTAPQEECVKNALTARAQAAGQAVQKAGGFVFQTVEINKAQALAASEDGTDTGVFAVTKEIRFPRIEGDSPQVKRFNDLMQQRPQYGVQDQTSEWLNYKISFAGPELVSVRFTGSDMSVGAAHPNDSEKVVTVVMATGEPLKETDVFAAPPARWQAAIVQRCRRELVRQLKERGAGADEIPAAELQDTAIKTKNWAITDQALVVIFPSESLGSHALGAFEVTIPWTDLAPLLNPAAPAPIRRT